MAILEIVTTVIVFALLAGIWLLSLHLDEFAELFGKFLMIVMAAAAFFFFFLLRKWL